MNDEQDLIDVACVLGGNLEAFAGIVDRWQRPLVTLAFRFCRDRDLAEDMAQIAFVTAFRKLDQWRQDAKFSSWLMSLATNVYRSELRRHRLPVVALDAIPQLFTACVLSGGDNAIERERLVRAAVLGLPRKYRDAITLFYFHQMDVHRTAESLGLPVGTVKAQLHRGRALLEKELGPLLQREYNTEPQDS